MIMKMNDPLLPSLNNNSRTYTYESDDVGNEDMSSVADSSMASTDLASSAAETYDTTTTVSGMSASPGKQSMASNTTVSAHGGGSGGGYSAKSARFKSAMTTRARQRRMRRMRERETLPEDGSDGGQHPSMSPGTPGGSGRGGGSVQGSVGGESSSSSAVPSPPPVGVTSDRVQSAKEHVAQMKNYRKATAGSPTTTSATSSPVITSSPLQNRMYQAHRSRSMSRSRESPVSSVGGSVGRAYNRSPSSPNLGGSDCGNGNVNSMSPSKNKRSTNKGGPANVRMSAETMASTPQRNGSSSNNNNSNQQTTPATSAKLPNPNNTKAPIRTNMDANASQHSTLPNPPKPTATRRARREKYEASQPNPDEFLPDWKAPGIDQMALSPEEVRDAANFTSIQFQCSNLSGEVEMFSGDELPEEEKDTGSVFSGPSCKMPASMASVSSVSSATGGSCPKHSWQNEVWVNNGAARTSGGSGPGNRPPSRASLTGNDVGDALSDATTPSIFHRGEIFHQKAAASIVSLLSPDRMVQAGLMAPEIANSEEDDAAKDVDGDSPTGVAALSRPNEMFTFDGDADPSSSRGGQWKGVTQVNRELFHERDAENVPDDDIRRSVIFNKFRQKMMMPSSQLAGLLGQIHRRDLSEGIDRAFATRRKNACGALKILSAKEENRMKICWTVGVLPAIASVLSDVNVEIPDDLARAANIEARNRVVSTLLNLGVNKKNRMLIVNTPGVLESMAQCILYDRGEGRQGCCTVLLYLAKTVEARRMIVKSAGMMDVLAKVVEVPSQKPMAPNPNPKARKARTALSRAPQSRSKLNDSITLDGDRTVDSGGSSYRSRSGSESDDDSRTSYGSMTHSVGSKSSADSSKSEDDDDHSQDSGTVGRKAEQMEISFETSEMENPVSKGREATKRRGVAIVAVGGKKGNKAKMKTASKDKDEEEIYDADPNRFLHGARLSVFACLLCLVKSQENAFFVAREKNTVEALIGVCKRHSSPSHSRAMAILAHLTRHPKNCHTLVFNYTTLLPMLQGATASPDKEARRYAFCALQNLSMDKSCRAPIAHSPKIIWCLTERCKLGLLSRDDSGNKKSSSAAPAPHDDNEDEAQLAAVATLQNLSDEPANVIQFTIVKDCIGTIIQIAREDVVRCEKTNLTSFMAKNTLVTLSHWFRKIATSGSERMGGTGLGNMACIPHPGCGRNSPALGGSGNQGGGAEPPSRTQVYLYNARLEPTTYDQWT